LQQQFLLGDRVADGPFAVEPDIKDRSTASWEDVKELTNRKDDGLFQAGRYGQNQPSSSNTTSPLDSYCEGFGGLCSGSKSSSSELYSIIFWFRVVVKGRR
jgi:hypothetical protein